MLFGTHLTNTLGLLRMIFKAEEAVFSDVNLDLTKRRIKTIG